MEKYAWKATIRAALRNTSTGDNLPQEMKGCSGGYATPSGTWKPAFRLLRMVQSSTPPRCRGKPVVEEWNRYMSDILIMEMDPETGAQPN